MTERILSNERGTMREAKLDALEAWIVQCERDGIALTHMTGNNAVFKRTEDADCPEILQGIGKSTIERYVRDLQSQNKIDKYQLTPTGGKIWLGSINGDMSRGVYEATTGRDNV
jgi:hypothetical protein